MANGEKMGGNTPNQWQAGSAGNMQQSTVEGAGIHKDIVAAVDPNKTETSGGNKSEDGAAEHGGPVKGYSIDELKNLKHDKLAEIAFQAMSPAQRAEYAAKLAEGYEISMEVVSVSGDDVAETKNNISPEGFSDWKKSLSNYEDDFFDKTVANKAELEQKRRQSETIAKKARRFGFKAIAMGMAAGSLMSIANPKVTSGAEVKPMSREQVSDVFSEAVKDKSEEKDVTTSGNEGFKLSDSPTIQNLGNVFGQTAERIKNTRNVLINGEVVSMDLTIGGTNTGEDITDIANKKAPESLTTRSAKFADEGGLYREAENDPVKMQELTKDCYSEILSHEAYLGAFVESLAAEGRWPGEATTPAFVTDKIDYYKSNTAAYNEDREWRQQREIDKAEAGISYSVMNWTLPYGSTYVEIENGKPVIKSDSYVPNRSKGVLILQAFDKDGNNYYNKGAVKQSILEMSGEMRPDMTEEEQQEVMESHIVLGREVGCKQFAIIKVKYEKKKITTTRITHGERSSSTSKEIIPPVIPEKPGGNENGGGDGGSGGHEDENHEDHEDKKRDNHEDIEKDKDKKTRDKEDENEHKDKDKKQRLDSKTGEVRGANEDDDQRGKTDEITDGAAKAGNDETNARVDAAGGEVSDKKDEQTEVVENYTQKDENGVENEGKSISTTEGNANLNTGSDEKQSDANAKEVIPDGGNESVQGDAEVTAANKTEWNFQDDILSDNF